MAINTNKLAKLPPLKKDLKLGFILFHAIFCLLVGLTGCHVLKLEAAGFYGKLKLMRRLNNQWALHLFHYIIVNHPVLIFTTAFASFASLCLFGFFWYIFSKYKNNMTINEDFKIDREVQYIKYDMKQKLNATTIEKKGK